MTETENRLNTIPEDQKGSFASFLKTLSSFTGDLSKLTCPSFLLDSKSLLELSSYWADHPEIMVDAPKGSTEEDRFYGAIKWFISALNGGFSTRVPNGGWEKKPFNPILGEQYFCTWQNGTRATCEQVCHHPPISAFKVENEEAGVSFTVNDAQRTRFSGTQLLVDQIGYCLMEMKGHNERYLFSLPSISVNGLWYAAPYTELFGTSYVQSSTGFFATIEYSTKGWIHGDYHYFKATINHRTLLKDGPTIIKGQWTKKSTITKHKQKSETFLDLSKLQSPPVTVSPISEQSPLESQKVWEKVSKALKAGDYQTASIEKSIVENNQRALRKEREEKGEEWKPVYFEETTSVELFGELKDLIIINSNNKFNNTFDEKAWKAKEGKN
ncbi:hypothetical protein BDF20DRAFT_70299 [Mycotypha africana]|uniref:uncharacterized protein n=1 Tax=Mycotypha africana TaxID=64632 RepID=UPI002301AA7E|nr:uncharacterized protein BDF20DRAFT_70299 [Mycotypha africana]KAI8991896.1 hypothetical protein BDF20DRAFT_70299 [Mycotypha africana]